MATTTFREDGLTLEIRSVIDAPRAAVWRCWTEPGLFKRWFCPKPWTVIEADFDLRPGGRMNSVLQGPDGATVENVGVWLDIAPASRLTFTDAYAEGFVPRAQSFMTSSVDLSDGGERQTMMVWSARHARAEDKGTHLAMGVEQGWSTATDQLEALAKTLDDRSTAPIDAATPNVRTCLWFHEKGAVAARFYVSLLPDSRIETIAPMGRPEDPMLVDFTLAGAPMRILTAGPHHTLSPAASIAVSTQDQEETDRLWSALLADGGAEGACGWLTDRYGVSWQIIPEALPRLLGHADPAAARRVQAAMMQMTKIEIAALKAAAGH